jgi:hypothetical protein
LAHIVVQPVQGDNPGVASFVANYGCLAHIESVSSQESEPGLVLLTVLIVAACCKLHTTVNTWYTLLTILHVILLRRYICLGHQSAESTEIDKKKTRYWHEKEERSVWYQIDWLFVVLLFCSDLGRLGV